MREDTTFDFCHAAHLRSRHPTRPPLSRSWKGLPSVDVLPDTSILVSLSCYGSHYELTNGGRNGCYITSRCYIVQQAVSTATLGPVCAGIVL